MEAEWRGSVEVFPNPVSGNFLKIKSEEGISKVRIFSAEGKEVYRVDHPAGFETSLDISGFPDGIYLIVTNLNNESYIEKIFIRK